ncbi:hypothetical protein [Bacteroides acidifaciens]|nr:hypothetical protein [uncultured Bacteroides sp.]
MLRFIHTLTGLQELTISDKGRILLYFVAFVPMIYKLISPFFILAGLANFTVIIIPTMAIVGIVMCRRDLRKAIRGEHIFLYFLIAILLALSPIIHSETQLLFEENYGPFVTTVLPFFFVGLLLDYGRDRYILRFVARIGIFVQMFWQACLLAGLVQTELGSTDSLGEQMEVAYQLLFPILILYISLSKERNIIDIILAIIGTILLFMMGTRGPIVVYGVFVVGYLVFFRDYKKYAFLKRSFVIFLFGLFYSYLEILILAILPIASTLGFSTRVFDSILDNRMVNLSESSSRDDFYGNVISVIKDDNGLGQGWLSDRLYTPDGMYVHNLELEILCQFGCIVGGGLLLYLFFLIYRSFRYNKKERMVSFWYVMLCSGFFALQFSYTYVKYPLFAVFIGFLFSCGHKTMQKAY